MKIQHLKKNFLFIGKMELSSPKSTKFLYLLKKSVSYTSGNETFRKQRLKN